LQVAVVVVVRLDDSVQAQKLLLVHQPVLSSSQQYLQGIMTGEDPTLEQKQLAQNQNHSWDLEAHPVASQPWSCLLYPFSSHQLEAVAFEEFQDLRGPGRFLKATQ
jgi:hypothetical protein